jgi:hypothetical protein
VHLTDLFEPHTTGTTENNSFASFEKGKAAKLISENNLTKFGENYTLH